MPLVPDKLNIGCGARYLNHWENLDVRPVAARVRRWDVRRGLPYPDGTFRLVYLSHLVEHLTPEGATALLRETHRVLQPDGIVRVVAPDLEIEVRQYLDALQAVRAEGSVPAVGSSEVRERYEWSCIDLLDQMVRTSSGGRLLERLVRYEHGIPEALRAHYGDAWLDSVMPPRRSCFSRSGFGHRLRVALRWRRRALAARMRSGFFRAFPRLGERIERRRIATYLQTGERHQWMYDAYSLRQRLEQCGFHSVLRLQATETRSAAREDLSKLDLAADGEPYMPRSLYMEAIR